MSVRVFCRKKRVLNRVMNLLSLSRLRDAEKRHSHQTMSKLLTIFIFLVVMFLVHCRQSHGHTKIPKKDNASIRGHKSKRVVTKSTLHLPGVPGNSHSQKTTFASHFCVEQNSFGQTFTCISGSLKKAKSPLTSIWELLRTFKGDEGKYWRLAGGFTKKSPMRFGKQILQLWLAQNTESAGKYSFYIFCILWNDNIS